MDKLAEPQEAFTITADKLTNEQVDELLASTDLRPYKALIRKLAKRWKAVMEEEMRLAMEYDQFLRERAECFKLRGNCRFAS